MAYRANVTDKQQSDVERAADDSAIRFTSFDAGNTGTVKSVKAYDLSAQALNGTGATSVVKSIPGSGSTIGQHNDHLSRFDNPGKA